MTGFRRSTLQRGESEDTAENNGGEPVAKTLVGALMEMVTGQTHHGSSLFSEGGSKPAG
jgi:hypothetical protein